MNHDRLYVSQDGNVSVVILETCLEMMISFCSRTNGEETGSVLVGHYSEDGHRAFVVMTEAPPIGSKGRRMSFSRSASGLKKLFDVMFHKSKGRSFYVGEWHLHPGSSVLPSPIDDETMISISNDHGKNGMILIILGGTSIRQPQVGVYVYRRNQRIDLTYNGV